MVIADAYLAVDEVTKDLRAQLGLGAAVSGDLHLQLRHNDLTRVHVLNAGQQLARDAERRRDHTPADTDKQTNQHEVSHFSLPST